jgi:hypothetical protein
LRKEIDCAFVDMLKPTDKKFMRNVIKWWRHPDAKVGAVAAVVIVNLKLFHISTFNSCRGVLHKPTAKFNFLEIVFDANQRWISGAGLSFSVSALLHTLGWRVNDIFDMPQKPLAWELVKPQARRAENPQNLRISSSQSWNSFSTYV